MKFKTLRYKKEPKEFVEININNGSCEIFVSELPCLLLATATMENFRKLIELQSNNINIDFDDFELIEIEMIEVDKYGADIRNKLSSLKNFISLYETLKMREFEPDKKRAIENIMDKNVEVCKKNIEYIANLL